MRGRALFLVLVLVSVPAAAAMNDWAEGTPGVPNGASRDYYNRAAFLPWDNYLGDWADASGVSQGDDAYAVTGVVDNDTGRYEEWDVTTLVQQWVDGTIQNKGFFLRGVSGAGPVDFRTKEHTDSGQWPELVINGSTTLNPEADTYLEPSTYQSQGDNDRMRISAELNSLLRFDVSGFSSGSVTSATLRLYTYQQYGGGTLEVGVFRCDQGHDEPYSDPIAGIAADYDEDVGIDAHSDVLFFADFETGDGSDGWTSAGGTFETVDTDAALGFVPLSGRALKVLMAEGANLALSFTYEFQDEVGEEPDEIYWRYYLRFASDWNQTVDGGKMPGIAGTYGTAGWGGRPSDGTNGWSARGSFSETIPDDNPLAGRTPLGYYCYHADMEGTYGDVWHWLNDYRGLIPRNEWHAVEEYARMNTPGSNDGVLRTWVDGRLAFEKTDISMRTVDTLHIEEVWMNIYHGGTDVSPYDQHLYIDNVVIARDYIGPWIDPPVYPDEGEYPEDVPEDVPEATPEPGPEPPVDGVTDDGVTDVTDEGDDDGPSSSGCGCALVH
jgi:hypothetical protein